MAVELLPHQVKAVEELRNGCVLKGGVGSGKTPTALAYYWTKILGAKLNDFGSVVNGCDLYIFTTALKRDSQDWQTWASRFCLSATDPNLSVNGIRVVVESYNNMHKYRGVKNAFLIFDEQRLVGSGLWSKTFLVLAKSNAWIMLSATPGDKWEDYIPIFIANGWYKNRTEFTRSHCVYSYYGSYPRLERYLGIAKLNKLRAAVLVEMPFAKHTVRHLSYIDVAHDKDLLERVVKKRWNPYKEKPLRDVAELFATMRKVVNSDSSRIEELRSLMRKHPRLIVFYNYDYELEILRSLADSPMSQDSEALTTGITSNDLAKERSEEWETSSIRQTRFRVGTMSQMSQLSEQTLKSQSSRPAVNGTVKDQFSGAINHTVSTSTKMKTTLAEWNGHKHEPVPESERWVYLVQYAAGAEAWNCITTDAIAYYSLTYSYRYFEQSQGRIDRLDTPFTDLYYYVLRSKSQIDLGILRALKSKKNFNEKEFIKQLGGK